MSSKGEPDWDDIQAPAIITPLHAQDRELSKVAGSPRAWRRMSQLEAAYMQERLGARDSNEARDRLQAGLVFTRIFDASQRGSRDSTEAFAGESGGQRVAYTEAQGAALARLARIEAHLGERDKIICRAVLAFGHSPAQAMALARLGKDTRVSARFCEALDALADALERTAKSRRHP